MGKILFLDFDGVLNFVGITPWEPSRPRFEDEPIQQLNRIVEQVNCSIVITSAWRTQRPVKFWANLLRNYGGDRIQFLASPTRFTARILKLEGPYGEGKPACGPYVFNYCACGEPVHEKINV